MKLLGVWTEINPGESEVFGMDFANAALTPGDSIQSCTWALSVAPGVNSGIDANAQSHVISVTTNVGTVTSQRIAGTADNVLYIAVATAVMTPSGDIKKVWGYLPSFKPGVQIPLPN